MSGQVESVSITLLVGLPGAGKQKLAEDLKAGLENVVIINEPRHFSDLTRYPVKDLIIADSYLCMREIQERAKEVIKIMWPTAEPTWIFFENNLATCMLNATGRGSVLLAEFLSARYHIPAKYHGTLVPVKSRWNAHVENTKRWCGMSRKFISDEDVPDHKLANFTI